MQFCCECRGPCRRTIDITQETYSWLRSMGTVLSPECAEREQRNVLYRYNGGAVVVVTNGWAKRGRTTQEGAP